MLEIDECFGVSRFWIGRFYLGLVFRLGFFIRFVFDKLM